MNNILEVRHMKKLFREDKSHFLLEELFDWMITICDKQINETILKDVQFHFESSEEEEEPLLSDHSSDEDTPEE